MILRVQLAALKHSQLIKEITHVRQRTSVFRRLRRRRRLRVFRRRRLRRITRRRPVEYDDEVSQRMPRAYLVPRPYDITDTLQVGAGGFEERQRREQREHNGRAIGDHETGEGSAQFADGLGDYQRLDVRERMEDEEEWLDEIGEGSSGDMESLDVVEERGGQSAIHVPTVLLPFVVRVSGLEVDACPLRIQIVHEQEGMNMRAEMHCLSLRMRILDNSAGLAMLVSASSNGLAGEVNIDQTIGGKDEIGAYRYGESLK
ncbi:hypothetical protein C8Q80DRAFT_176783 [Daedaleopsis nitida]|nr:hypothetical protein C8Q80DRAFT_176783 [Daedaleopsis nitida]